MRPTSAARPLGIVVLVALAAGVPLAAQRPGVTLTGLTQDSAGHPLPGTEVIIQGTGISVFTDTTGTFRLTGLAPGERRLLFQKVGFGPLQLLQDIAVGQFAEIDIGPVVLRAVAPRPITLAGTLTSALTHEPVEGASILLARRVVAHSRLDGGFSSDTVPVRDGDLVAVRRIGYRPVEFELWLGDRGDHLDLAIALKPVPVALQELIVEGNLSSLYPWWETFERHRKAGLGSFLTEARIKELPAISGVDLLKFARGVFVTGNIWADSGHVELFGALCAPPVYLIDGIEYPTDVALNILNVWPPDEILGVEVYPTPRRVPPEYKVVRSRCGVIAVWRKH